MRFTTMELHKRGVDNEHIFVSMERNMSVPSVYADTASSDRFLSCKDGPVFQYGKIKDMLVKWESDIKARKCPPEQ